MVMFDLKLSEIDTVGYVRAAPPAAHPSLLDVTTAGRTYEFQLLAAHGWERHQSVRGPGAGHAHDVYHVVLYVDGRGVFGFEGGRRSAGPGVLSLTSPGQAHDYSTPAGRVCYHALTFALRSPRGALRWPLARLLTHYTGHRGELAPRHELAPPAFAALRNAMETLARELADAAEPDGFQIARHMVGIFDLLIGVARGAAPPGHRPTLTERAQQLLNARYHDETLTLRRLAGELHASPEHLCRVFHQQTGLSPMVYRNRLRMQAAQSLLRNSDLPCKTIADRLGYADLYAFSKAYRRIMGVPPTTERKRTEVVRRKSR